MSNFDLHNCLLFEGIDGKYIDDFLANCDAIDLHQGEFLFHQNEIGDAMYIVEHGELQVILEIDQSGSHSKTPRVIKTLKEGELIGELCVFGQEKRSASIRSIGDARVLKIEGEDFRVRIYSKELDALLLCYNIVKLLSERLVATNELLSFIHVKT